MNTIKQLLFLSRCFYIVAKEIARGRSWHIIFIDIEIPEGRRRYEYSRTIDGVKLTSFDIIRKQ